VIGARSSPFLKRFVNSVPLYPLALAAGAFAAGEAPEPEAWVEPLGRTKPTAGRFVARVVGRSMERRISDGAYCVFGHPVEGSRQGRIVVVEHRSISDPDTGGSYTVKRYESEKVADPDGGWRHDQIRLLPDADAPGYEPIVLSPDAEVRVIAELIEVLPGMAASTE